MVTRQCATCNGDKKIMQSTGDPQHPLRAIECPNCTHVFFGIYVSAEKFAEFMGNVADGECPFCGRTGLTARYGSNKKHMKACLAKQVKASKSRV
jgi:hypothetical protein